MNWKKNIFHYYSCSSWMIESMWFIFMLSFCHLIFGLLILANKCAGKKPMDLWRTLLGVWKTKVNPKEGITFLPLYFICKTNLCVLLWFYKSEFVFLDGLPSVLCVLWCHLTHVLFCSMLSGMVGGWVNQGVVW